MIEKHVGRMLVVCLLIHGCHHGNSSNTNAGTPILTNAIDLDLSIPGSFGAAYLYGPAILCDHSIISGTAQLSCDFTPVPNSNAPGQDTVYITDLAASIADGCVITGISSDTQFIGTPFVSAPCISGTSITCTANGVNPTRSTMITNLCP